MRGSSNAQADLSSKQDTLTFDTVPTANSANPITSGGVYTAMEGVGGGEVWEEVDLTKFPTDWTENDRIKVLFKADVDISTNPSSWTTSPNGTVSITTVNNTFLQAGGIFEFSIGEYTGRPIVIHSGSIGSSLFVLRAINNTVSVFNTGYLFDLQAWVFNGGGFKSGSVSIFNNTTPQYINKMWRLKQ